MEILNISTRDDLVDQYLFIAFTHLSINGILNQQLKILGYNCLYAVVLHRSMNTNITIEFSNQFLTVPLLASYLKILQLHAFIWLVDSPNDSVISDVCMALLGVIYLKFGLDEVDKLFELIVSLMLSSIK